jgi:hypothetical protein
LLLLLFYILYLFYFYLFFSFLLFCFFAFFSQAAKGYLCTMELPSFQRQLRVLGYMEGLDAFSLSSVKSLVVWLEEKVFDVLDDEQRGELRNQVGEKWEGVFHDFLEVIGSPFAFGPTLTDIQRATVIEWLLNLAISRKYEERADELAGDQAGVLSSDPLYEALREGLERCNADDRLLSEAQELSRQVGLPCPNSEEEARALILACSRHALRVASRKQADQNVNSEWLPISTDKAADLLRVLYCEDAAEQERRANTLLVLLQNLTAAPVVDASLGKGGR